ncbi:MAG: carbon monoxide dehydrogenase [Lachnospiraceae bacterium]|nr:carbon monoxide dehydrogenase [Lachnospiraceae bacterium]
MQLYDKIIEECLELFKGEQTEKLAVSGQLARDAGGHNLILRSDMAYELGGGILPAIGGLAFTTSKALVEEDGIWLQGPDLQDIQEDTAYARIVFIRLSEGQLAQESEAYALLRKIAYTRYHLCTEGFMLRISASENREVVRVGKHARKQGLNFAEIGRRFLEEYHKIPEIMAAQIFFITARDFPYQQLAGKMQEAEGITNSLNHIFQNLKMDCSVCNMKPVCDEVEGLKEIHQKINKKV